MKSLKSLKFKSIQEFYSICTMYCAIEERHHQMSCFALCKSIKFSEKSKKRKPIFLPHNILGVVMSALIIFESICRRAVKIDERASEDFMEGQLGKAKSFPQGFMFLVIGKWSAGDTF